MAQNFIWSVFWKIFRYLDRKKNGMVQQVPTKFSVRLCITVSFNNACISCLPRWRHQMETFSAWLSICAENSPVTGEFIAQRPVTRSFDVFFDLRPNARFSKQSWGWWFETSSRPLLRQSNALSPSRRTFERNMHSYSYNAAVIHFF